MMRGPRVGDLVRITWGQRDPIQKRSWVVSRSDAKPHQRDFDGQIGVIVNQPFPNALLYEVRFPCGTTMSYEPWFLEVVCEAG
jgi:hypothetical protein